MRILFVSSEIHPWIKTGGLADVSAALPMALHAMGIDVRVLVPGYRDVLAQLSGNESALELSCGDHYGKLRVLSGATIGDVPVDVIDAPHLFDRSGGPYLDASGREWADNAIRFGALGRVAALLSSSPLLAGWQPDILHCNDWQAGLAPAWLKLAGRPGAKTLVSIHNLAYQGLFDPGLLEALELPSASFTMEGLEFHGKISFMKAALHYADAISTVSPTYAREIQTAEFGCGLDALLLHRNKDLTGILNGIDTRHWNPATDPLIPTQYGAHSLDRKMANRRALREQLGLMADAQRPLIGVVSRLAYQKGIDYLIEAAGNLCADKAQLVVLGSGDTEYESQLQALAKRWPAHIAVRHGYDEPLAHLIEAGADMFAMPSRYEPCGLNQMYSMRYGTPPVVRRTGGLADSVIDADARSVANGTATGFVFDESTGNALQAALLRAINIWHDKNAWGKIQRNGMAKDFSWSASAKAYLKIYQQLLR